MHLPLLNKSSVLLGHYATIAFEIWNGLRDDKKWGLGRDLGSFTNVCEKVAQQRNAAVGSHQTIVDPMGHLDSSAYESIWTRRIERIESEGGIDALNFKTLIRDRLPKTDAVPQLPKDTHGLPVRPFFSLPLRQKEEAEDRIVEEECNEGIAINFRHDTFAIDEEALSFDAGFFFELSLSNFRFSLECNPENELFLAHSLTVCRSSLLTPILIPLPVLVSLTSLSLCPPVA